MNGETQSYFNYQMFNYLNNQNVNIYLHAGETQFFPQGGIDNHYTNKNYINDNLFHAALLPGVKRIGHGFEAYKNNLLLSINNIKNIHSNLALFPIKYNYSTKSTPTHSQISQEMACTWRFPLTIQVSMVTQVLLWIGSTSQWRLMLSPAKFT
ncbi:hypothetical protein TTHERM_01321570 (macronuclear) [Tetrahymena thermophila SB210]|uniref:Uncharacterized protein n=1 Tax=Tetrahymena thermophila (strain SB210) TaxID=312017 RepID=Q232U1_TETTS|nr:hypothetical protein TTHERM_01321570 [Tetrahymena thermophila SB210]EAR91544.2 hypothetical protein TTHERM_01321570 [Tetrahymena thermophila SB210]|eukprot:XP_001011789.2 hypothetical protein TTHERM_01321570 [Tetrahymena thermophila SB210]